MAIRYLSKLGYGKAPSFFKRQSTEVSNVSEVQCHLLREEVKK